VSRPKTIACVTSPGKAVLSCGHDATVPVKAKVGAVVECAACNAWLDHVRQEASNGSEGAAAYLDALEGRGEDRFWAWVEKETRDL
jgi:hypothetical protein